MVTECRFERDTQGVWKCATCGRVVRSQTGAIKAICDGEWTPQQIPCGPGCQLKKSLAWWGIRSNGSCGCDSFAAKMDAWGCDECWQRLEEIVEHLRQAAAEKGLPFIATAARIMVGRAIEAARKEVAHATQAGEEGSWTNLVRAR